MEKKFEANQLRKKGELEAALKLYTELREGDTDPYVIAGLLHCQRKLGRYEEAFPICDLILKKFLNFDWCKNEAIWTLIQGQLEKLDETASVEQACYIANNILKFEPIEMTPKWRLVRRVLKAAKSKGQWQVISEWIEKVKPEQLSDAPMKDESGREGWSDQAIWYNLKIRSTIEVGDKEKAIDLSKQACKLFPRQKRFFARLEALATLRLSRLVEAEKLYKDLCHTKRPDWWVLQEYAEVLKDLGKKEIALKLMCKAAASHNRIEALVTLFQEIGDLCLEMGDTVAANNHFRLCKFVREDKKWSVPYSVEQALQRLSSADNNCPNKLNEAESACRGFWRSKIDIDARVEQLKDRNMRPGLNGKVELGQPERPFCFIVVENREKFFCFKSYLPQNISDGAIVMFDAIPSFDKKKNRESWKATNIRVTAS